MNWNAVKSQSFGRRRQCVSNSTMHQKGPKMDLDSLVNSTVKWLKGGFWWTVASNGVNWKPWINRSVTSREHVNLNRSLINGSWDLVKRTCLWTLDFIKSLHWKSWVWKLQSRLERDMATIRWQGSTSELILNDSRNIREFCWLLDTSAT